MLSDFKDSVKQNKTDFLWILTILLIGLSSFGAGLLIDLKKSQSPIIIHSPQTEIKKTASSTTKENRLIGSINSNKYHHPDCPWSKKISPQNQIWFDSEKEAQEKGYSPCGNFEKYNQ